MAEVYVRCSTFVLILSYVLDHCPAGRSNDDLFSFCQGQTDLNVLVFHAVHDAMNPNKVPMFPGPLEVKINTQHQRPSTMINSRHASCCIKPTLSV